MTLIASLYSGWSGLRSNSEDLAVIGDNIANANTIGFKGSRAEFEESLAQSMLGAGQIGMGTQLQSVHRILAQGSLLQTGQPTDLALQGPGFFLVKGNHNGVPGTYYTRAGQFSLDKEGMLSNLEGLRRAGLQRGFRRCVGNHAGGPQRGQGHVTATRHHHRHVKANLKPGRHHHAAVGSKRPHGERPTSPHP